MGSTLGTETERAWRGGRRGPRRECDRNGPVGCRSRTQEPDSVRIAESTRVPDEGKPSVGRARLEQVRGRAA